MRFVVHWTVATAIVQLVRTGFCPTGRATYHFVGGTDDVPVIPTYPLVPCLAFTLGTVHIFALGSTLVLIPTLDLPKVGHHRVVSNFNSLSHLQNITVPRRHLYPEPPSHNTTHNPSKREG